MTTYEIIAQSIGIVAMTINIFSFQQKEQRKLIIMQFFGASLFAVNMFMIGAAVGGFLNLIGAFRAQSVELKGISCYPEIIHGFYPLFLKHNQR